MPRRPRIHVPGGFYHVTLRGNHRQPVFQAHSDRALLNMIVARAIQKFDARLHAYCWMSNHLHFLIQVSVEPLARPMRQIAAEFARAMQVKLATTGHFFERRYHATLIEATDYLFTALRYIHRNPVDAGMVATAGDYPWSSHHAYVGHRTEPWLTTDFILGKFAPVREEAILAYAAFLDAETGEQAAAFPEGAFIFGSDEFTARVQGMSRKSRSYQQLQELITEACGRFEVTQEKLVSPVRNCFLTKVRAWIAHQASERGIANRSEVARALGRTEGALRRAILAYPGEVD
jgi:REP element-mobilizing transposase RayT